MLREELWRGSRCLRAPSSSVGNASPTITRDAKLREDTVCRAPSRMGVSSVEPMPSITLEAMLREDAVCLVSQRLGVPRRS
mmetsp:Transcript_19531/g.62192  ORF Transcript_19531/g.62192 Transcript_19531/m.62192 type:complete len:81 (-) Transcript_19531:628-870(-)